MALLSKTVIINSNFSKQEVIALVDKNIEPWHKDGSSLIFEGRITPDGEFNIRLGENRTQYRTRVSIVVIKGSIQELQDDRSIIKIDFTVTGIMKNIIYTAGVASVLFSLLLHMNVINLEEFNALWFLPLFFYGFLLLNFYLTFQIDKNKASAVLQSILS